jgi:hypothetical protein
MADRTHALAFNALTQGLSDAGRFVALSERETITAAVVAAVSSAWEQRSAAAEARIDAAVAHHPRDVSNPLGPWCPTCLVPYPCPTVLDLVGETSRVDPQALAKMLEGAEERRQEMLHNPPKPTRPEDLMARLGKACVHPSDLAEVLSKATDTEDNAVSNDALDRLFAALKLVTDAEGDDRG